jgi:hypothetical protein
MPRLAIVVILCASVDSGRLLSCSFSEREGEMIRFNQFVTKSSVRFVLATAFIGAFVLAAIVPSTQADSQTPPREAGATVGSDFPHAVKFEQGATRFKEGDKIEISEIRGTSERFGRGNIYVVKGTYSLASHDRATLAAYITTTSKDQEFGHSLKVQHLVVERGQGTFTLFLPMYTEGLPHISFYATDSGEGFGGNYFGTGDSVLKKWWGAEK